MTDNRGMLVAGEAIAGSEMRVAGREKIGPGRWGKSVKRKLTIGRATV